ncbi:MAG: hypothetical protein ABL994_23270, partial [Verrucomicrobiales bacterium]
MKPLFMCAMALGLQLPKAAPSPQAAPATAAVVTSPFLLKIVGGLNGTVEIKATQIETKSIIDRLKAEVKVPINASALVSRHKVDVSL